MADQLAVGTEPSDLTAGAIDEGPAAGEARDSLTKKRRTSPQVVPMDTEEEAAEVIAVFASGAARARPCSFVPDVPLEVFYKEMKLGLESFSSWWKNNSLPTHMKKTSKKRLRCIVSTSQKLIWPNCLSSMPTTFHLL